MSLGLVASSAVVFILCLHHYDFKSTTARLWEQKMQCADLFLVPWEATLASLATLTAN